MTTEADLGTQVLALLTAQPKDRRALKALLAPWPKAEQLAALVAAQHQAGRLFTQALVTILELDETFDSTVFGALREAHLAHDPEQRDLSRLWQAVGAAAALPDDLTFTAEAARAHHALRAPDCRVLRLGPRKPEDEAWLADIGLDPQALRARLAEFLQLDEGWKAILDGASFASPEAREIVTRNEAFCSYQDRAVAAGHLVLPDPVTGRPLTPVDSCLLFGRSCYFFLGAQPFYLICAGAGAKALCLYFPRHATLIDLGSGVSKFLTVGLFANTFSLLSTRFLQHRALYNAVLQAPLPAQTALSLTTHLAANPAHHLWNFFTPLERIIRAGQAHRVARLITGGTEFYGKLGAIFPEFADRIQDDAKPGVLDPHPFDPGHLLLTVGGYFILQSLKDRMRAVARAATHRSFTEAQMADLTKGAFPVVWIGMRLGDKSWADQEAGIQALAEGLFARHPRALILLDGFSYPVGRDEVSGKWAAVIAELHALGARVMAGATGRGVQGAGCFTPWARA